MSTCGKISAGITHNCLDKLVSGLHDEVILINLDDIDKDNCTFDANNKLIITDLVLKTASPALAGYKIEGYNFSNEHDTALVKRRFIDGWDHNFLFRVFDNTPEVKKFVTEAVDSRFVAIIKNKYRNKNATTDGTTVFEVLGFEHGLEISEATRNVNDEETMGAWVLKATCDETNKEPYPPYTFFKTDLATTQTAFDAFV
jgi:hypothetical protein